MRVDAVTSATALPGSARVDRTNAPARVVEPKRTAVSIADIRGALSRAHRSLYGHEPTQAMLDTLTAQVSHETGRGEHMYNYNFGGIKGKGPTGATAACMTSEVLSQGEVRLRQNFRAYDSLDQGAIDYVAFMHGRYNGALQKAEVGDLDGFAHALKQSGYYTASENDYAAALRAHAGVAAKHPGKTDPASFASDPSTFSNSFELGRVVDMIASASARIAAPDDEA